MTAATVVPLEGACDEALFGAKAVGLGEATRSGLPVPPGIALAGDVVELVAKGDQPTLATVTEATRPLTYPLAIRSSAVGEDSADASFAGQHLTLLNVTSPDGLGAAIREVWWSANSDSVISYRKRVGLFTRPSVGVVVQSLMDPEVAGVMFTQNPVNGADERVVEASWGLGEVVVAARVIPDHFRLARSGLILERSAGLKEVAIRATSAGGTVEEAVATELQGALCLNDAQLGLLGDLAARCEEIYGPGRDIEWAYADGRLYLLQCRAVTHGTSARPKPPSEGPVEVLAQVPLFLGLSEPEVAQIASLFKERRFAAGETIIKEGVGAAAFFVIRSGEAAVSVHGRPVSTLRRGDYFGEVALIDDGDRSATITASTDVVCQGLTYWEFRPLVQANAAIAWNLLQTLAKRLRSAEKS
ncbi:PEP/pyruvate-binding domain-containing protein [Leekyejoonella antrihumi]|uniref:Cyclic nucleotide-binding domain-containing protein n=1 Tax=Leekyejoonella antrihumi TaxID=1660198 RepID=A0A563E2K7_9MICO|nr:PEP/pyruvate-binding domain-containing protein [Leekyejoonella antrihumi]TWP36529.1 cyclic nucleotide-binding domain-containing protein [Leekyejoonella antrihumi]